MKRAVLLAAMLLVQSSSAMAKARHDWQTYINSRFGYSFCYPADLLHPQPESANGDGRVFVGPNGAKLLIWGSYNALGESAVQSRDRSAARLASEGYSITYQADHPDWYVISGSGTGGIFYQRTQINRDREVSFELRYPANRAAIWNPVSARLSRCLAG